MVNTRLTVVHLHIDGKTYLSDYHFFQGETWTYAMMNAAKWLRSFGVDRSIISAVLSDEARAANGATVNKCFQPDEWKQ